MGKHIYLALSVVMIGNLPKTQIIVELFRAVNWYAIQQQIAVSSH